MSHFTKVEGAQIVSKDSFIEAVKELGFKDIKENAPIRGWDGNKEVCDVAVRVPDCKYDFGIKRSADGKRFDLIAESFMRHEKPGLLGKVVQTTTKRYIVAQYRRQGFAARVSDGTDGKIVVTLTR